MRERRNDAVVKAAGIWAAAVVAGLGGSQASAGVADMTADRDGTLYQPDPFSGLMSNGGGDAFFAGFLYGYARGHDVEVSMRYATIAGGLCTLSHELVFPQLSVELIEAKYDKHFSEERGEHETSPQDYVPSSTDGGRAGAGGM